MPKRGQVRRARHRPRIAEAGAAHIADAQTRDDALHTGHNQSESRRTRLHADRAALVAFRWLLTFAAMTLASHGAAAPEPQPANASGEFGLYPAPAFRITTGECKDCPTMRQALWYFRDQVIAVPLPGHQVASFATGVHPFEDVRRWAAARPAGAPPDFPPLVWTAAPSVVRGVHLSADGGQLTSTDGAIAFRPTAKIPLNRSYYNESSVAFFRQRSLTVRGTREGHAFVARTIWPEDFRLGPDAPSPRTLPSAPTPAEALRSLMREEPQGGAQSPYAASTLWRKDGMPVAWAGRPVIALMVNGAQGDDDEAHGGHFAVVTGRVQADGRIGDWLVNNFYSLDVESEKGIIAAPVPLDNYLADLNSGQGWYRPSYMVVAVLADERAPVLVQSALNRVFNQFWRHQLVYYHPNENCASISIDTLRALGWEIPTRGPTSRTLAWAGFPLIAVKELSVGKAKLAFDYLRTDQTRLMPAAALEEAFGSLMALRGGKVAPDQGPLARLLAQDMDALVFLRFPQLPSSRAFGDAPAVTTWEYKTRIPNDPALAQIVPVPPRPFPDELRDPDLLAPTWRPSDYAVLVWGVLSVIGIPIVLWRLWKWRHMRRH
jgi:hypothetical protein